MRGERVTGPEDDLGTVVELRELPVPDVRRGSSAPFTFEDGRSGWVARLPEGNLLLTPSYSEGRIYVGGGFASSIVYALDAETGAYEWSAAASDGGPSAVIIEDDEILYNTESCTIFAVDKKTGRPLWSRYLGDPMMSQPAAADGRVFTAHAWNDGHGLTAIATKTGRVLWQRAISADLIAAPTVSQGRLFYTTHDGIVERRDPESGRLLWRKAMRGTSAPWVDGDRVLLSRRVAAPEGTRGPHEQQVILSATNGRLLSEGIVAPAPHLLGKGRTRRILQGQTGAWNNESTTPAQRNLGVRSIADGWAYQGARPTVIDGRSYAAVGDAIECREIETGRLLWRRRYAQDAGAQAMSPPAVVGSQMVVATIDGHVYSIDIDSGTTTWAYDVGEPIPYQPSVARGWVYVGTATGKVIAFEAADESLDGWHMWGGNSSHDGLVPADATGMRSDAAPGESGPSRDGPRPRTPSGTPKGRPPSGTPKGRPSEGTLRVVPPGRDEPAGLPLEHTSVRMDVSGFAASVTVLQTFANPFEEPLEAIYHFPLPTNAAVDAMVVRVGQRTILGRIERRQRARQIYNAARAAGAIAALLEEQRPDLFSQRVANVPPGSRVTVELHYVQTLPFEDGGYELRFPLVTDRRAADPTASGEEDGLASLDSAGFRRPEEVDLSIDLDAGVPVNEIVSPSHVVRIDELDPRRAIVTLDDDGRVANRDFVLRYHVAGERPRAAVLSHMDARGGFFTLMLQPARDDGAVEITKRRLTFALDTSSSMMGLPMEHAKAVVEAGLESLGRGDSFQIVSFSDLVRAWPEGDAAEATDERVIAAESWVGSLRPLGTTSMAAAIDAVLDRPAAPDDVLDLVVVVTDGYVAADREILRQVAEGLGQKRLLVVGVGASVNRFLLERLAEVGRGKLEVVLPSEDPEVVAARLVARIDRPQLTDLAVDWGDLSVHGVYPRRLPDLYAGQPLFVSGRFDVAGEDVVRVTGRMGGRAWQDETRVVLDAFAEGHEAMAPIWARARVTDLMNALWLEDDPEVEEAVTRLGLDFGLVTRFTSFIAVEDAFFRQLEGAAMPPSAGSASMPMGGQVGESYGFGGLGLSGSGAGGGGVGYGTLGIASAGRMGYGLSSEDELTEAVPGRLYPRTATPVTGSLSREVVQRVIRAHLNEVRFCYDRELTANRSLSGRVTVRLVIGPSGHVTEAAIDESTLGSEQVEACIAQIAARWLFPETDGSGVVVVRYPFVLAPAEPNDRQPEARGAPEPDP